MRRPVVRRGPHGQVLIITAFAMLALLAVVAVVIDLGFSWMLRRHEQNAADPAAIAAAQHIPTGDTTAMRADACFFAQLNGFFAADANCAAALASGDLTVNYPPAGELAGGFSGDYGKVQVVIRDTHPSFFARIFQQTDATVTTGAVAANDTGLSNSSSLVALQPVCQGGAAGKIDGGGTVRIFPTVAGTLGGYVHVNSPCGVSADDYCDNGVGSSALQISGRLVTPFAYVTGSCTYQGSLPNGLSCEPPPALPCPDEDSQPPLGDPLAGVPEPNLSDFPNGVCPDGSISTPGSTAGCELKKSSYCPPDPLDPQIDICSLQPGVYFGGWKVGSKVRLFLEPGMYILAGGGIGLSGGEASIEAVTSPSGIDARITIFSTDGPGCPFQGGSIDAQCQSAIKFTADQAFLAKATNAATCGLVTPQACPWKGILLWQDGSASNPDAPVELGGQASTVLAGTIYAPRALVKITGGSDTTGCSSDPATQSCLSIQIISYTWQIGGNALVEMPYDPNELYQLALRGLVH